ncbi:hypothetical protein BOX15_Mlig000398g4, partial [Macrostomum lignano]
LHLQSCGPSGYLVAVSHPIKLKPCCLVLKLQQTRVNSAGYCFCRTENVIVTCGSNQLNSYNDCYQQLVQCYNKLAIGNWLDLSDGLPTKPVKLTMASGSEYGCWRLELNSGHNNAAKFPDCVQNLVAPASLQIGISSSSSEAGNCNCIVGQCSTYRRFINAKVTSLSLTEGFAYVNILSDHCEGSVADSQGEPALLALFPSTSTSLSRSMVNRTIQLRNAHLYTGSACQAIKIATNNRIATVIVAYVYTSLHCPKHTDENDSQGNDIHSKINNQHWLISELLFNSETDDNSSTIIRLLAWSITLQSIDRSSDRGLLVALCKALLSLSAIPEKETRILAYRRQYHKQLVEKFVKLHRLSDAINPVQLLLATTIPTGLSLASDSSNSVILIGRRIAFDPIGERLRLDFFTTNSNSSVAMRLIHDGPVRLNLSARMVHLVVLKLPIVRASLIDWDGSMLLLVRCSHLATAVASKINQRQRRRSLGTDSIELTVNSCHSVSVGSFSLAGTLKAASSDGDANENRSKQIKVLMEMSGSASVLRELLLPSGTYRIVSDEISTDQHLAASSLATSETDCLTSATPLLISLKRRPISVECVKLRQSDWLTPSRARVSRHLRLFALRGRLLDFGNDRSGCHGNAWLLIGDPIADEEAARVQFCAPLSNIRRLEMIQHLASSNFHAEDVLLLNVSRRQFNDAANGAANAKKSAELLCVCSDINPTIHLLSVTRSANGRPTRQTAAVAENLHSGEYFDSIGALIEFNLTSAVESGLANWFDEGRVFQLDCFLSAVCRFQFHPSSSTAQPPLAEAFVLLQDGTQSASLSCRGFYTICRLLGFPNRFVDSVASANHAVAYRRCWDENSGGGGDGSYLSEVLRYHLESSRCRRPVRLLVRLLRRQPPTMLQLTVSDLLPRQRLPDVSLALLRVMHTG